MMKTVEKFGEYLAIAGGIFFIAGIPAMTIAALVTANMQSGAWTNVMINIGPYVIGAIVATLFVLGFRTKEDDAV